MQAADKHQRREAAVEARYERDVKRNLDRRESTERYISHNIRLASEWDPSDASYATYSGRWSWSGRYYKRSVNWTLDSRRRWQSRTDAAFHYLENAVKGLRSMQRMDRQAVELGLQPTYQPGQINQMLQDCEVKGRMLMGERNRRGN